MTAEQIDYLHSCRQRVGMDLVADILPFWLENGLDRENGGIFTCLL